MWRFLSNRRLILRLPRPTIFRALTYWAHRAVVLAIAWFPCLLRQLLSSFSSMALWLYWVVHYAYYCTLHTHITFQNAYNVMAFKIFDQNLLVVFNFMIVHNSDVKWNNRLCPLEHPIRLYKLLENIRFCFAFNWFVRSYSESPKVNSWELLEQDLDTSWMSIPLPNY